MATTQQEHKEIHHFGEPWSLKMLERIPHLHFFALFIREVLHSIKTLRDIDQQNKAAYEDFVALCNNDIVFFLKITQQYYLLSKLFGENNLNQEKWAHLLDELREKYHQQQIQTQNFGVVRPQTIDRPIPISTYSPPSHFAWTEPDPAWSNFQKWEHYENELKRITTIYHQQKATLYQETVEEDLDMLDSVLDKLKEGSSEYDDVFALKKECENKKKELLSRNLHNSDGQLDPGAVEKFQKDWFRANRDLSDGLKHCCNKYKGNKIFEEAYAEHQARHENLTAKINKLDVEFDHARSELSQKINECRMASTNEVDSNLKQIGQALDDIRSSELTEQQKGTVSILIKEIEECRARLPSIKDPESYQQAVNDITKKINAVTRELPPSIKEEISGLAEPLSNVVVSLDSLLDEEDQLAEEQEFITDHVIAEEDNFDDKNINEVGAIQDELTSNHSEMLSSIEKQKKMKLEVNNIKNQNPPVEQEVTNKVNKTEIEEISNAIQKALSKINSSSLSSEEKEIVGEIRNNITKLKESSSEELSSIISTLSEGINNMGEHINKREELLNSLDSIKETVESQLEAEESVNFSM